MSNDITWCDEAECPEKTCFRNPVNMKRDGQPWHSYAKLKGTILCPIANAWEPTREGRHWTCSDCGDVIQFMDKYCHNCGRRQKWE